jgi:hypothetical protein
MYYNDYLVNALKEIIALYSENHTKAINTLCERNEVIGY